MIFFIAFLAHIQIVKGISSTRLLHRFKTASKLRSYSNRIAILHFDSIQRFILSFGTLASRNFGASGVAGFYHLKVG